VVTISLFPRAVPGVSRLKGILCLALLPVSFSTAYAGSDQEAINRAMLAPRPGMASAATVTPRSQAQDAPEIYVIGNAASLLQPFAAGQLITILGPGLGPTPGVGATFTNGFVTTSAGGTQVTFDGIAAPILYAGASQINTAIPCAVAGNATTAVVVTYMGVPSTSVTIPLSAAAPGVFALANRAGQGAVLNQDYSVNGPSNPAVPGSTIIAYGTGLGKTSPACDDGEIYNDNLSSLPMPVLSVTATVGNLNAVVQYAGQAPGFISGAEQINIVVPANAPAGPAIPVTIAGGGISSQTGVTVAVQ
jgi:uncharacterized protein (TIGR03437 family)